MMRPWRSSTDWISRSPATGSVSKRRSLSPAVRSMPLMWRGSSAAKSAPELRMSSMAPSSAARRSSPWRSSAWRTRA